MPDPYLYLLSYYYLYLAMDSLIIIFLAIFDRFLAEINMGYHAHAVPYTSILSSSESTYLLQCYAGCAMRVSSAQLVSTQKDQVSHKYSDCRRRSSPSLHLDPSSSEHLPEIIPTPNFTISVFHHLNEVKRNKASERTG